jgi:hypothetical protein
MDDVLVSSDESSDSNDEETIENLMNLELDNHCKIVKILKLPIY